MYMISVFDVKLTFTYDKGLSLMKIKLLQHPLEL